MTQLLMGNTKPAKRDMTTGSVWKAILAFAIPIMLGNMLQQLYNTVDGIIVGRVVSQEALAAVGSCSALSRFFLCFSMGFSNGCAVMISQYYGARREDDIRKAFTSGAIIAVGIGTVLAVLGIVFCRWIITFLMNISNPAVARYAQIYFAIYCAGLVFTYAYNFIAYTLRSFGDSRATLYFLGLASILNLILDLVMVPLLGIAGAAIATVISQFICFVASYLYMIKRHGALNIRFRDYRIDLSKVRMCLNLCIPAILQQCSVSFGNLLMQRLVNGFSGATMAAYTVGAKVEGYLHAPVSGVQQSMSVFTGQNMGAGKQERIKKGLQSAVTINLGWCAVVAAAGLLGSTQMAQMFGLEGESLTQAVDMIRYYTCTSCVMLFYCLYFSCSGIIQGSGDVGYATFVSLSALATRVVISYIAVYVFCADYPILWQFTLVSTTMSMILAWTRYFSEKWKKKSERIIGKPQS